MRVLLLGDATRFWSKVDRTADCWLWTANRVKGYGHFKLNGKTVKAHRYAWYLAHGEWPSSNMFVCHHCDNPACVRPEHLFLGTVSDNAKDMVAKQRHAARPGGPREHLSSEERRSISERIRRIRRERPERFAIGERHPVRRRPELRRYGDRHWTRLHPESVARGEQNGGGGKLTEEQVCEIKRLLGTMPKRVIARQFGVSDTLVRYIETGRAWRHIS